MNVSLSYKVEQVAGEVVTLLKRINLMLQEFHRGDIHVEKHQVGAEASRKTAYYIEKPSKNAR